MLILLWVCLSIQYVTHPPVQPMSPTAYFTESITENTVLEKDINSNSNRHTNQRLATHSGQYGFFTHRQAHISATGNCCLSHSLNVLCVL